MTKSRNVTPITTLGIDIENHSCHVVGFDERGAVVLRQKFTASKLEACIGAHHLASV